MLGIPLGLTLVFIRRSLPLKLRIYTTTLYDNVQAFHVNTEDEWINGYVMKIVWGQRPGKMKTIVWIALSSRVNNGKKKYTPLAKLCLMRLALLLKLRLWRRLRTTLFSPLSKTTTPRSLVTNSLLVSPPPVESPSINYFWLTGNTVNSNLVNIPKNIATKNNSVCNDNKKLWFVFYLKTK